MTPLPLSADNTKNWWATLSLLAPHTKGSFVLVPCLLLTLWATLIVLLDDYTEGRLDDSLPVYVPTVLGSTMGILLGFRLNSACQPKDAQRSN